MAGATAELDEADLGTDKAGDLLHVLPQKAASRPVG